MHINVTANAEELGRIAGETAAVLIRKAIAENGTAHIILATGTSQFETLKQLVSEQGIDWSKVVMFHLDEYIDLPITHPASFRRYLQERFIAKVPALKAAYLINGETDPIEECERLGQLIEKFPIDIALVGIGENGHLAFNDPPADFDTVKPYLIVKLEELSRRQQLSEGWFNSIGEVPHQAISMSVNQIMRSKHIICSVPDERKAGAVKNTVEQKVSNVYPASILKMHPDCTLFLDKGSSSHLAGNTVAF